MVEQEQVKVFPVAIFHCIQTAKDARLPCPVDCFCYVDPMPNDGSYCPMAGCLRLADFLNEVTPERTSTRRADFFPVNLCHVTTFSFFLMIHTFHDLFLLF